ncbi:hypothetical protein MNB_SV-5-387 [hydrothermal vent metagenome]|uniref:Cytochrome c domain-containing protein n=1 Tax=hydrothermal vent metagenome TaxID=652676 RepID=A0A1W1EFB4_9ZZZZ
MNKLIMLLIPFLLNANEDFISHYEYGEMLYSSPRGVSCSQCHGDTGEGKVIVTYKDEDGKKIIAGSDIRHKNLSEMIKAVNTYHEIMPRYYLTDEEVKAIYDFIQKKNEIYLLEFSENNSSK